jgi:hypothetical protein
VTRFIFKAIKAPSFNKRIKIFHYFLKEYIRLTERRYFNLEELQSDIPNADIYCTGSDQMWNRDWNGGIEKPFFLEYAPAGKRCFAYSTSFGKAKLDNSEKEETKRLLAKYNAISVREKSGVEILEDLDIQGMQLIDPTLILKCDSWRQLIAKRSIRQDYVLVYQLNKNKEFDQYAKSFSKQKGLKLIRISYDYNNFYKPGRLICCPKVEEFLSLIYYAGYVITDSFHGTAFSINFNKKFAVISPPRFGTRLYSLLELTGLSGKVITDFDDFTVPDINIDYDKVNSLLDMNRAEADDFLDKALKINAIGDNQ